MLAIPAPTANAQRSSPCVFATDPSRNTVSRYTCGFSHVRARQVSAAASSVVRGAARVAVAIPEPAPAPPASPAASGAWPDAAGAPDVADGPLPGSKRLA